MFDSSFPPRDLLSESAQLEALRGAGIGIRPWNQDETDLDEFFLVIWIVIIRWSYRLRKRKSHPTSGKMAGATQQ